MSSRPSYKRPRRRSRVAVACLGALLALFPLAAAAQRAPGDTAASASPAKAAASAGARGSIPGDTGVFELREIVVSARRPVSQAAATVRIVDGARMRALGARTLDQALAPVPGVGVRTGGEGVPRVEFRGFRPRQLLVLLDGVPLNSTFDGQPDLSLIPTDHIASIKVIGGTASVLYGEALGGVFEVVTRDADPGFHGESAIETREGDGHVARLDASAGAGPLRAFASGNTSSSAGFLAPAPAGGTSLLRNTDRGWSSAFGSATLSARRARVGLIVNGGAGHYGIPSVQASASDPFASRATYRRVNELHGAGIQLSGAWLPTAALSLRGWSFANGQDEQDAQYDDSTYSGMSNPALKGTYRETARTRLTGGGLQAAWTPSPSTRLSVGLFAERDAWSVDGVIRDVAVTSGGSGSGSGSGGGKGSGAGSGATTYNVRPLVDSRSLVRAGGALEWEITPLPSLAFSLGAARHALVRDSAGRELADALVAGASWRAPGDVRLRASAARRSRFPTIAQLYATDGGNPALTPERATELELGAERALGAAAGARLDLFRADVTGFINRAGPAQPYGNRGLLRFQGVEGALELRPIASLGLDASLAYLRTADRSPGANDQELQYTPRLRALLDARWRPDAATTVAASIARVAHQVYYSRQSPMQSGRLPDYT
ncbi:MAG TPA: TonB-dependent receptor, partial [Longimicrobiales bacterium]